MKYLLSLIAIVVLFFLYIDREMPLHEVDGCYLSENEKICIYPDGKYQQLFSDGEIKNEGKWRKFEYSLDEGTYIALQLLGYKDFCQGCKDGKTLAELDVFPKITPLSKAHFYISNLQSSESKKTLYKKES